MGASSSARRRTQAGPDAQRGLDQTDVEAARQAGVACLQKRRREPVAVGEHTFALILASGSVVRFHNASWPAMAGAQQVDVRIHERPERRG